ncbi:MAG: 3-oxoacyl-[acyl-carrier-protein] synthase III C-terminal domain-containing protein [Thermocrispum sp.]
MRLIRPITLSGLACWLPKTAVTVATAIRAGSLDAEDAADLGYRQLPVERELAPPEMAVLAGREAMSRAGVEPLDVGLLLHTWMFHQGHDLWSPPHYIAGQLDLHDALPIGVQQVCNGSAAAIELAAARLFADRSLRHAVITTADRFLPPGFDRWRGDYGVGYGDGATAVVLDAADDRPAELTLLSIATLAAPELERMHRGDDGFSPAPGWHSIPLDIRRTKKAYLSAYGMESFAKVSRGAIARVIRACLTDANVHPDDDRLRWVAMPRVGRAVLEQAYRPAVAAVTGTALLDLSADTGHLGAGDALANLAGLSHQDLLRPGELAMVLNAGAGFTWSCLLVRR